MRGDVQEMDLRRPWKTKRSWYLALCERAKTPRSSAPKRLEKLGDLRF